MDDRQRRIARARLLRRDGKTYDEIRNVVGPVDNGTLRLWCRGIPRPPETLPTRALKETRRECRRLRASGLTYQEIAAQTGASTGSLSLWLRDIGVSPARRRRAQNRPPRSSLPYAVDQRRAAEAVRARRRAQAAAGLVVVSDRELLAAGVALYLAEGSKAKPWRPRDRQVVLTNSDPSLLTLFLAWLDLLGVSEDRRSYRLSIHESADARAHERWWQTQLSLPAASFRRATFKRHKPKTVRKNVNEQYHGCLVVRISRPAELYDAIEGWWQRLVSAAESTRIGSVGCIPTDSPGWSKGMTRPFGGPRWGFESSPGSCGT
jgi:hypothetical protein